MSGLTRCGHSVGFLLTCWHRADCTESKMSPPCHHHKMSSLLSTHMHFVGRLQGSFVKSRIFFFHICLGFHTQYVLVSHVADCELMTLHYRSPGSCRPTLTADPTQLLLWFCEECVVLSKNLRKSASQLLSWNLILVLFFFLSTRSFTKLHYSPLLIISVVDVIMNFKDSQFSALLIIAQGKCDIPWNN